VDVKPLVKLLHVPLEHHQVHDDHVLEVDRVLQRRDGIVLEQDDVGQKSSLVKQVQKPERTQTPEIGN